jgi:hypothetical protein
MLDLFGKTKPIALTPSLQMIDKMLACSGKRSAAGGA